LSQDTGIRKWIIISFWLKEGIVMFNKITILISRVRKTGFFYFTMDKELNFSLALYRIWK
jgi:hypothetical protein